MLYRDAGLKWIATDEAVLFKSLGSDQRDALYYPYTHKGITMGFRDHGLSDLIGFTYRFWEAERAADHFISSLHSIVQGGEDRTVFIILDGENAWEFYSNNAFDFFDALNRYFKTGLQWLDSNIEFVAVIQLLHVTFKSTINHLFILSKPDTLHRSTHFIHSRKELCLINNSTADPFEK